MTATALKDIISDAKGAEPQPLGNIYQRLIAVANSVGGVQATGQNQFKTKAVSIGDVESAIRSELAAVNLITRWSNLELEDIGGGKLWRGRYRVAIINADNPDEKIEDEWEDIGGNPMAASSFARKGYYKALFHLTEEDDESGKNTTKTAAKPPEPPAPEDESQEFSWVGKECPECHKLGFTTQSKKPSKFSDGKNHDKPLMCLGWNPAINDFALHTPPKDEDGIPL